MKTKELLKRCIFLSGDSWQDLSKKTGYSPCSLSLFFMNKPISDELANQLFHEYVSRGIYNPPFFVCENKGDLNEFITKLRKGMFLTKAKFAKALGISNYILIQKEKGKRNWSVEDIKKITDLAHQHNIRPHFNLDI